MVVIIDEVDIVYIATFDFFVYCFSALHDTTKVVDRRCSSGRKEYFKIVARDRRQTSITSSSPIYVNRWAHDDES